jgi:hypothetical protein
LAFNLGNHELASDDEGAGQAALKSPLKPKVHKDDKGVPRLPVFPGMTRPNLEDMKTLIRDFINLHYHAFLTLISVIVIIKWHFKNMLRR